MFRIYHNELILWIRKARNGELSEIVDIPVNEIKDNVFTFKDRLSAIPSASTCDCRLSLSNLSILMRVLRVDAEGVNAMNP
jgi:hypothetical protein